MEHTIKAKDAVSFFTKNGFPVAQVIDEIEDAYGDKFERLARGLSEMQSITQMNEELRLRLEGICRDLGSTFCQRITDHCEEWNMDTFILIYPSADLCAGMAEYFMLRSAFNFPYRNFYDYLASSNIKKES